MYNDIVNENKKLMYKVRENGLLLSDQNIEVLERYDFNYQKYSSLKELIFDIDEYLNNDYNEDLDKVAEELQEIIYYNYTNK